MAALAQLRNEGAITNQVFELRRRLLVERYTSTAPATDAMAGTNDDGATRAPANPAPAHAVAVQPPEPQPSPAVARAFADIVQQRRDGLISAEEYVERRRSLMQPFAPGDPAAEAEQPVAVASPTRTDSYAREAEALADLSRRGEITPAEYSAALRRLVARYPEAAQEPAPERSRRSIEPGYRSAVQFSLRPSVVVAFPGSDFKTAVGGGLAVGASIQRTHDFELEGIRFQTNAAQFSDLHFNFTPVLASYTYNFWTGNLDVKFGAAAGSTFEEASFFSFTERASAFTYGLRTGLAFRLGPFAALEAKASVFHLNETDLTDAGRLILVDVGAQFRF